MAAIEVSGPQGPDRVLPEDPAESKETSTITADNKSSGPENPEEQILSKDESITSPSDLRGESTIRLEPLDVDADRNPRPQNVYPHAHAVYYGGYENSRALWDEYSQFFYSEGMELGPPGTHPLIYHTGYGYSPQMPFGPYSPVTPLPLVRRESQMYSSPESPLSGPYYHQPGPNTMAYLNSPSLSSPSNSMRSVGPGPSFLSNGGSGGGGISTNLGGQYFHDTWQGFDGSSPAGLWSDRSKSPDVMRPFTPLSPSASPFGRGLSPFAPAMRPYDRGTRRDRTDLAVNTSFNSYGPVNASVCSCNGPVDFLNEQNRGPRAAVKPRSLAMAVDSTSSVDIKPVAARVDSASYNKADFKTDYDDARFFVIKSYSEDNVHKSIKYGVWASTPNGNRKLDTAYSESKAKGSDCPIFLLFSVNASAHFCGVAEMAGAVDFEKSVDYWQQDKWSGHFPVKWHVIKDVPNSLFRHIILENNDNKPVTNSRDTQEVKMEQGLEMLTIFKGYESCMSILDDFDFYEGRERAMGERKAHQRQQQQQAGASPAQFPAMSVAQMQKTFAQAVRLDEKKSKKDGAPAEGAGGAAEYFPNLAGAAPLKGG